MAADDAEWKQKYFDTLGQLETKEREWREIDNLLRQGISRLTLITETRDDDLKTQIETLRGSLRAGTDSEKLAGLLENLSNTILKVDEERRHQPRTLSPAEVTSAIIDGITFPRGMGHRGRELKGQIESGNLDQDAMVKALVDLIMEMIAWVSGEEGDGGKERGGLLGKLFGGGKETAQTNDAGAEDDSQSVSLGQRILRRIIGAVMPHAGDSGEALMRQLHDSDEERQLVALADSLAALLAEMQPSGVSPMEVNHELPINEVLLQLMERLEIPQELRQDAEVIKGRLAGGLESENLQSTLEAIADLITEMRRKVQGEKRQLEEFLKNLTVRLKELDQNLQLNVATQRESFEDGRNLDDAVRAQVEDIETSVQEATELTVLQHTIGERLETIRGHMARFRDMEEGRIAEAEQQVEELNHRLQEMESEVGELRQKVKNERYQALVDPLTGIPNRLAYNERMEGEFARWQRYGNPFSFAVWDVDHFKKINDQYGHQAGDKVLRVVAKLINSSTRTTDFVARFGGEEFVMLLPETELDKALLVADKIREAVATCEFHHGKRPVPITISCGVAQFRTGDTIESAFERADTALYQAKSGGRNRCVGESM